MPRKRNKISTAAHHGGNESLEEPPNDGEAEKEARVHITEVLQQGQSLIIYKNLNLAAEVLSLQLRQPSFIFGGFLFVVKVLHENVFKGSVFILDQDKPSFTSLLCKG